VPAPTRGRGGERRRKRASAASKPALLERRKGACRLAAKGGKRKEIALEPDQKKGGVSGLKRGRHIDPQRAPNRAEKKKRRLVWEKEPLHAPPIGEGQHLPSRHRDTVYQESGEGKKHHGKRPPNSPISTRGKREASSRQRGGPRFAEREREVKNPLLCLQAEPGRKEE